MSAKRPTGKDVVFCSVSNRVLFAEDAVIDSDGVVYAPEHAPTGITQLPGYNAPAGSAAPGAATSPQEPPTGPGLPQPPGDAPGGSEPPTTAQEPDQADDPWTDLGNPPRGKAR